VLKNWSSDAGGPRFESQIVLFAGWHLWQSTFRCICGIRFFCRAHRRHSARDPSAKGPICIRCTDSSVVRDRLSDAGGPRFESQTGGLRVSQFQSLCINLMCGGGVGVCGPLGSAKNGDPCPGEVRSCESRSCTDSPVVRDPISDAGGPRFESHAGRVTGKPTPKPLE